MSSFKDKAKAVKALFENFDRLEKSVQAQLMEVADKMAPKVQGSGIAPKAIRIPEPVEYPDIKETAVHIGIKKHQLEHFADQFLKSDWHPVEKAEHQPHPGASISSHQQVYDRKVQAKQEAHLKTPKGDAERKANNAKVVQGMKKTQKNPSTTVPYEEKPHHRDYIAPTNNVAGELKAAREKQAMSPAVPAELHASGAMAKAIAMGPRPPLSPIKPPTRNIPDEPKKTK